MNKKPINPPELFDGSPFGMSQAVCDLDSKLVFISGQVDWNQEYQTSENSVEGQTEKALQNLQIALDAANSSVDNLLQVRIYIRGELGEYINTLAPILSSFFGESRPALTGIGVASLASPETLVEIEAVAKRK
ncbi:RidA family protein [Pleurocapsa sp. PCC 7319]|uniref:RidA family protein n=1 Tax=Pleurocapsa sp. PCC 7319 TaxID=118161 RepID=UPI000347A981|nr:RidA family protein [Pleurocapsa sp. PCC 7319]